MKNGAWNCAAAFRRKERAAIERVEMPQLDPAYRITCNEEVNQGITEEQAVREATRCLDCNNPQCVTGCPVGIDIPKFIKNIERRHFADEPASHTEGDKFAPCRLRPCVPTGKAMREQVHSVENEAASRGYRLSRTLCR